MKGSPPRSLPYKHICERLGFLEGCDALLIVAKFAMGENVNLLDAVGIYRNLERQAAKVPDLERQLAALQHLDRRIGERRRPI